MGKKVHVLPRAVTFVLELWPKKRLSLCLSCWVVGSPNWLFSLCLELLGRWSVPWVGSARSTNWLFSLCLELCGSAGWYIEWALPGPPACVCGPIVCGGLLRSLECRVSWLVSWVSSARSASMCLWPLCCEHSLCESWVHFPLIKEL